MTVNRSNVMTKLEKAALLDKILLKFDGNKTWSWNAMHEPNFYTDLNSDYFVVESHLNYLIGDGVIDKVKGIEYLTGESAGMTRHTDLSKLTPKGLAIMTDLTNLGYFHKEIERQRVDKREEGTFFFAKLGFWVAAGGIILTIVGLFKCDGLTVNLNW